MFPGLSEIKNCIRCNSNFISNKLITGDNVCPTCLRMNSMTFWFPMLLNVNFPVPKTIIVNADIELIGILDNDIPKESDRFFDEVKQALHIVGLPAFIRTEMLSNKHDWKKSCFIENEKDIIFHVGNLVEMSHLATIDRKTDYWFFAVRELIKTEPIFQAFNNMPITKEVRVFIKNNEIQCIHPYWPGEAFEGHNISVGLIDQVQTIDDQEFDMITKMSDYLAKIFSGYWSIDFLKSKNNDWLCIDMAIGEASWHWKDCDKLK